MAPNTISRWRFVLLYPHVGGSYAKATSAPGRGCRRDLCGRRFGARLRPLFHQSLPPLQRARRDDYQGYGLHLQAYERFNTTIIKAYIKPLMKTYLNRLKGRLNDPGPQRLHDDCPWRRGSTWWRVGRLYGG